MQELGGLAEFARELECLRDIVKDLEVRLKDVEEVAFAEDTIEGSDDDSDDELAECRHSKSGLKASFHRDS